MIKCERCEIVEVMMTTTQPLHTPKSKKFQAGTYAPLEEIKTLPRPPSCYLSWGQNLVSSRDSINIPGTNGLIWRWNQMGGSEIDFWLNQRGQLKPGALTYRWGLTPNPRKTEQCLDQITECQTFYQLCLIWRHWLSTYTCAICWMSRKFSCG